MLNPPIQFTENLSKLKLSSSFVFSLVPPKIEYEIITTPLNKAHGLYSCPTGIFRSAKHIIRRSLSILKNKSVERGIYLSKLKLSKAIPIQKLTMKLILLIIDRYRFFLSSIIFSKKLMYHRLKSFLEKCNILHDS